MLSVRLDTIDAVRSEGVREVVRLSATVTSTSYTISCADDEDTSAKVTADFAFLVEPVVVLSSGRISLADCCLDLVVLSMCVVAARFGTHFTIATAPAAMTISAVTPAMTTVATSTVDASPVETDDVPPGADWPSATLLMPSRGGGGGGGGDGDGTGVVAAGELEGEGLAIDAVGGGGLDGGGGGGGGGEGGGGGGGGFGIGGGGGGKFGGGSGGGGGGGSSGFGGGSIGSGDGASTGAGGGGEGGSSAGRVADVASRLSTAVIVAPRAAMSCEVDAPAKADRAAVA